MSPPSYSDSIQKVEYIILGHYKGYWLLEPYSCLFAWVECSEARPPGEELSFMKLRLKPRSESSFEYCPLGLGAYSTGDRKGRQVRRS
jgi:hypothetical protein